LVFNFTLPVFGDLLSPWVIPEPGRYEKIILKMKFWSQFSKKRL